jgi:hypothetical protein
VSLRSALCTFGRRDGGTIRTHIELDSSNSRTVRFEDLYDLLALHQGKNCEMNERFDILGYYNQPDVARSKHNMVSRNQGALLKGGG